MQKVISYKVITAENPIKLEIEVIKYIEQGWEPTGGLTAIPVPSKEITGGFAISHTINCQAMIKRG